MGRVRGYQYDAVIGIGGLSAEPWRHDLAGKVVWIGIGPYKTGDRLKPLVTFDRFKFSGSKGPALHDEAPLLATHMYGGRVRVLLNLSSAERSEAERLLAS